MVRKLNHRFKNFLTVNMAFVSAVMVGGRGGYDVKMLFLAHFKPETRFSGELIPLPVPEAIVSY